MINKNIALLYAFDYTTDEGKILQILKASKNPNNPSFNQIDKLLKINSF